MADSEGGLATSLVITELPELHFGEKTENEANPENDVWFYECKTEPLTLFKNSFMVLYPNDLHCPGVAVNGAKTCHKVVVKVKV